MKLGSRDCPVVIDDEEEDDAVAVPSKRRKTQQVELMLGLDERHPIEVADSPSPPSVPAVARAARLRGQARKVVSEQPPPSARPSAAPVARDRVVAERVLAAAKRREALAKEQQRQADHRNSLGSRLLAKAGYREAGKGLGKKETGITKPIEPVRNHGARGLGFKRK